MKKICAYLSQYFQVYRATFNYKKTHKHVVFLEHLYRCILNGFFFFKQNININKLKLIKVLWNSDGFGPRQNIKYKQVQCTFRRFRRTQLVTVVSSKSSFEWFKTKYDIAIYLIECRTNNLKSIFGINKERLQTAYQDVFCARIRLKQRGTALKF